MVAVTPYGPVITQRHPPITSAGAGLIATAVIMPVVATLWTILRVWTRKIRGVSALLIEDLLCYLAVLFFWGLGINYMCMVILGGAGNHLPQLTGGDYLMRFSQTTFAAQVLYALTLGCTKMSITWMIKRIFFEVSHIWIPYCLMVLNFGWMMQTILTGILICRPITLNWDPNARGSCGNQTVLFSAVSIVDIVTDILIIALPVKMLWGLKMRRTYKIAVVCMFGAGLLTIAFTVVRLYSVFTLDFSDMTYNFVSISIIGLVQSGVAILVATAPLLRPAIDRTVESCMSKNSKAPAGFRQLSESEENLRWELDVMHAHKGKTLTEVSNAGHSEGMHEDELPSGQIKVTQSTQISRG
ncbi:integral membrane protein [Cordyceps javanica]|uniref:Integral membrane protein n=1 Tax=Cordyceps javanica TaxID=43265 RepID=A0A545W0L0_9HYPO|nr:integral membrane protein [Cordyceps javanica]TQW07503.1 integral membrane protein [Cordyceps javanica]